MENIVGAPVTIPLKAVDWLRNTLSGVAESAYQEDISGFKTGKRRLGLTDEALVRLRRQASMGYATGDEAMHPYSISKEAQRMMNSGSTYNITISHANIAMSEQQKAAYNMKRSMMPGVP